MSSDFEFLQNYANHAFDAKAKRAFAVRAALTVLSSTLKTENNATIERVASTKVVSKLANEIENALKTN